MALEFLIELKVVLCVKMPIVLYYAKCGAIAQPNKLRCQKIENHIKRKYHLVQELVHKNEVMVFKIVSEKDLVDLLTKGLPVKSSKSHTLKMGVRKILDMLYSK